MNRKILIAVVALGALVAACAVVFWASSHQSSPPKPLPVRTHKDWDKPRDCWKHPDHHGHRHCARF
jgi:hypothetical protein